jgi:hypothetical protein
MLVLGMNSCTKKDPSLFDEELMAQRQKELIDTDESQVAANAKNIFGAAFGANQDWNMLSNGKVTINVNADMEDIAKVRILAFGNGEITILNEMAAAKGQKVELNYDAPASADRLFAACVSSTGEYRFKGFAIGQAEVSFQPNGKRAATRRAFEDLPFPELPVIVNSKKSYNTERTEKANKGDQSVALWKDSHWNDIFYFQDEDNVLKKGLQSIALEDLAADEKSDLQAIISSYLPAAYFKWGNRYNDNYDETISKSNGLFAYQHTYLTTVGDKPVRIAPVYQSGEMSQCNLFYYFFKPEDVKKSGMSEVDYVKQLPKYQLMVTPNANAGRQVIVRQELWTLAYYGDETPAKGTQATSFIFPEGYKIGFVLRNFKHSGELYGDGRLNIEINQWGNFKTSNFQDGNAPAIARIAAFGANGKDYLCFEDGTDQDFDDLIIEIESGVENIEQYDIDQYSKVYTFAFEDRDLGDYDMNDVVVKAKRIDETHVKYSLEATGANDELYLRNINGQVLNGKTEIHKLFNKDRMSFVNTQAGKERVEPVQETIEVDRFFGFSKEECQIYIYNRTTGKNVKLATKGQDPHGILIPCDWQYPLESICVGGQHAPAYKQFNSWGMSHVQSTDWYNYPEAGRVYTLSVFK